VFITLRRVLGSQGTRTWDLVTHGGDDRGTQLTGDACPRPLNGQGVALSRLPTSDRAAAAGDYTNAAGGVIGAQTGWCSHVATHDLPVIHRAHAARGLHYRAIDGVQVERPPGRRGGSGALV
jgi:hypothetical protein